MNIKYQTRETEKIIAIIIAIIIVEENRKKLKN